MTTGMEQIINKNDEINNVNESKLFLTSFFS